MRMERSTGEKSGCFIILDIDEFKHINDAYGHPAGDRVLCQVAEHLRSVFGENGLIGRLGGDEFVVLVSGLLTREETEAVLCRLKESLGGIRIGEENVTSSIGVIPVEEEMTIEELYKYADRLLYEAKKNGKDQFVFGYRFEELNRKKQENKKQEKTSVNQLQEVREK